MSKWKGVFVQLLMALTLYDQVMLAEGFSPVPYRDSRGILTVGYGFNLERKDADKCLSQVGETRDAIVQGKNNLTREKAETLLRITLAEAEVGVKNVVPFWYQHPERVQHALIEMAFQLGVSGVDKFNKMKWALAKKDYVTAAFEMLDSKWLVQTPKRAVRLARRVAGV